VLPVGGSSSNQLAMDAVVDVVVVVVECGRMWWEGDDRQLVPS
jgi:hypothetical protein